MKLLTGLVMLAGLLWLERSLTKQEARGGDWFAAHPNGGGV